MTMALCFNCGEVKFGALCPCPQCQVASTGNTGLDIAFSDHHYAVETLQEFGAVIRTIQSATTDSPTRFWSFIHYVSTRHPSILHATPPPEIRAAVDDALRDLALPEVILRESGISREDTGPPNSKNDA